jgi:1-acyl-sn-glycerol-3-phosphate acyltransferase
MANTTPPTTTAASQAATISVEEYIASQPRYSWRRSLLRFGVRTVIMGLICRTTVMGAEKIPDEGPVIMMMNHISSLDPILTIGAVGNRYIVPMTKIENMHIPILGAIIKWYGAYWVSRGEVDRRALTNSIELLKAGQCILIAPEGTRQREGLSEAKDGLAYVATKANAVIVPSAVSGAVEWTKKLKRLQRPKVNVTFGRPFRFKTEGKARIQREELALMSQEAMYQLALAVQDEKMRGVYSDLSKATTDTLEFI